MYRLLRRLHSLALSLSETFFGTSSHHKSTLFQSLPYSYRFCSCSSSASDCTFRVFFTHYPTAYLDMTHIKHNLEDYKPDVYVSGHLHQFLGGDMRVFLSVLMVMTSITLLGEDWRLFMKTGRSIESIARLSP